MEAFPSGGLANLDSHARRECEIELGCAFAVDRYDLVGQHVFHLGAADAVHLTHDELHQRSWFRHLELQGIFFGVRFSVFIHLNK